YLFENNYTFKLVPTHFISLFNERVSLNDYLKLDENIIYYYFQLWQEEEDAIISDLCQRFINRRLFQYVDFNLNRQMHQVMRLTQNITLSLIHLQIYPMIFTDLGKKRSVCQFICKCQRKN